VELLGVWLLVLVAFAGTVFLGRYARRGLALRYWLALGGALGFLLGVAASAMLGSSAGAGVVVGVVAALALLPGYALMWKGFRG